MELRILDNASLSERNLDLDGYRPEGSGQARNAESGKHRGFFRSAFGTLERG
jgi:hypothetical protein